MEVSTIFITFQLQPPNYIQPECSRLHSPSCGNALTRHSLHRQWAVYLELWRRALMLLLIKIYGVVWWSPSRRSASLNMTEWDGIWCLASLHWITHNFFSSPVFNIGSNNLGLCWEIYAWHSVGWENEAIKGSFISLHQFECWEQVVGISIERSMLGWVCVGQWGNSWESVSNYLHVEYLFWVEYDSWQVYFSNICFSLSAI